MKSTKSIFVVAIAALILFAFTACNNTPSGAVTHVVATQTAVYVEGEKPASDGFTYTGYTNIGATVTVDPADITLIQDGSSDNYAIWCRGVDAGEIKVKFETVKSIEIDTAEAETKYHKTVTGADYGGTRKVDTTGVVVTAEYEGGSKIVGHEAVDFDTDAVNLGTIGKYNVSVTVGSAPAKTYEVSVVENLVDSVAAKMTEGYTVYYAGEKPVTVTNDPVYTATPASTKGIYLEKHYQGGETVVAAATEVEYQTPGSTTYSSTFPALLLPAGDGTAPVTMRYKGTDGIVGLNKVTSPITVAWAKNKIVSVELTTTPTSISKANGFNLTNGSPATGFVFASTMKDGTAGLPAPTANWWDGTGTAPADGNYVTVAVGDLDNLVVGDRYSFTVTGRVEGFTINESFEVVCN